MTNYSLEEEKAFKGVRTPRMQQEPVKLETSINTPATYAYDLRDRLYKAEVKGGTLA